MKTRRILAASTAALLAFGATAVIASADPADYTADTAPNSIKIGTGSKTQIGPKIAANDDFNEYPGYAEADGDIEDDLTANSELKAKLAWKDASKLKGKWEVKGEFVDVPEDDDEKVAVKEDEIKDLGLSDENLKILAKTAAADTKIIKIKIGKDGKTVSSISKPLTITVSKTANKSVKVYHVNDDGSLTLVKSSTDEAFSNGDFETTFSTTQYSPFIITTATLKTTAAADADSSDASAATSDGATSTNPETGIALAIAPVVLAAGAVAVVALKKKH